MTFFEAMHSQELGIIQAFQSLRTPWLDQVMLSLNFFDTLPFYLLILIVTWYGYTTKCGARVLALFLLTLAINSSVKYFLVQPRPFTLMPELGLLTVSSPGFPSGAAQCFITLLGYLALTFRKPWFTCISVFFLLLISFSRVYLGLHFPSDIIGGWLIGLPILFLFWSLEPKAEKFLLLRSKKEQLCLSLLAIFLLAGCSLTTLFVKKTFLFIGIGCSIGLIWGKPFSPTSILQKVLAIFLAISGMVLIPLITSHNNHYSPATFFLMGLWLSSGVPYIFSFKPK